MLNEERRPWVSPELTGKFSFCNSTHLSSPEIVQHGRGEVPLEPDCVDMRNDSSTKVTALVLVLISRILGSSALNANQK